MGVVTADGITDTGSDRRHDAHEDYVNSSLRPASEPFKVFHINLCWECMALPPFGSGHFASIHCLPGRFNGKRDGMGNIQNWGWEVYRKYANPPGQANTLYGPWTAGNEPWASLVTSCSDTFLRQMEVWNEIGHDVITMSELGNPGAAGMQFIGRAEATLRDEFMEKAQQQMDLVFYQYLSHNILRDYGVFGHVVVKDNIVTQATYWKKATLQDEPTIAVGIDSQHERPVSALFFGAKKVLVVNVHSVHFRKELISSLEKFGPEMGDLLAGFRKTNTRFRVEEFGTPQLRALFGAWIELKIRKALTLCTEFGAVLKEQVFCTGAHQGTGLAFANSLLKGKKDLLLEKQWSIFLGGDFNDETGELSQFHIFGVEVNSGPRKRTCCSDRDKDFKMSENEMKKPGSYNAIQDDMMSLGMTVGNFAYWVNDCKYFNSLEGLEKHVMDYMQLDGATKSGVTPKPSEYPWPSDMILSNLDGSTMEYPDGYAQRMSRMISDHDPIVRYFR